MSYEAWSVQKSCHYKFSDQFKELIHGMGKPILSDRPAFIICCHWWFMSFAVVHTGSHMSPRAYTLMTFEFIIQRHNQHTKGTSNGIDTNRAFPLSTCLTLLNKHNWRLWFGKEKAHRGNFGCGRRVLLANADKEIAVVQLSVSPTLCKAEREKIPLHPIIVH